LLLERVWIGEGGDAFARLHREVVAALRADPQRCAQLVVAVMRVAGRARVRAAVARAHLVLPLDRDVHPALRHQSVQFSAASLARRAERLLVRVLLECHSHANAVIEPRRAGRVLGIAAEANPALTPGVETVERLAEKRLGDAAPSPLGAD